MEIIQVKNVYKRFGDYAASNNISFNVTKGKVFGLLGPNGAGKTTMIRMLTNILIPDEGQIILFDENIESEHQNRIGYLPEERGLYKKVKVIEQMTYFGQLKGLSKQEALSSARFWLKKMDASDWENKKIQELSKGMQQKVQFISTILHNPDLLILDEPFSGFDPINTNVLKNIILDLKKEGKTIILSTHIMEQAEQLCDDICLINKGKILLKGELQNVKKSKGRDTLIIEFEGNSDFLDDIKNVSFINKTNNRVEIRLKSDSPSPGEILQKAINNVSIIKYQFVEPSLNEIFIDYVTKMENENE